MEKLAEKLRALPDLSDDERWLYAHSLVLTPDERYEASRAQPAISHGVPVHLLPVERIIKSKEAIQHPKDLVHLPEIRRLLAAKGIAGKKAPPRSR